MSSEQPYHEDDVFALVRLDVLCEAGKVCVFQSDKFRPLCVFTTVTGSHLRQQVDDVDLREW